VCLAFLLLVPASLASSIPGILNTGVNDDGTLLASGSADPHYRLLTSSDQEFPGPGAYVINDSGFPIPPWAANGPNSKWIAPTANQSTGNQPGDYVYRLVFDLTGLDPATAVITGTWTSDNLGSGIWLNGVSTGFANDGDFRALWNAFTITSGFVEGTNTLDFVVNNTPPSVSPTGLRVELNGTAEVLPPPGTPPSILAPPRSQTNAPGESVTFTVTATGARPLSYQWRHESLSISGATLSSFTINALAAQDYGRYDVIVTNQWGAATSTPPAFLALRFTGPAQLSYESAGPSSRHTGLAITEIMYHPADRTDGRRLEFIELFNSNPFPEDLSGYRLAGDWDFTFANGTVIPGLGYLVIAPAPADMQAVYGLTGVLGGFTNSLPNSKGSIRLCKRSGGVVLTIDYSDEPSWPIAADGPGHSLVLTRPSWGENNPKAWAASATIGGSPGGADPVPGSPLDSVMINELLSRADAAKGYLELYNRSVFPVDISGCVLTDDAAIHKYIVPTNTTIPAGDFIHILQDTLNFALPISGGRVFLINPAHDRVLDAVQFEGQEKGVPSGRYPDGADAFYRLATPTPGAANAAALVDKVVLNELMYNPISRDDDDQFVELYNRGTAPVSLAGWRLAGGINFTFPTNSTLAADSYLVIARNLARLLTNYANLGPSNAVGNFSGRLSHDGERVVLAKSGIQILTNSFGEPFTNSYAIPVDEVSYGTSGRWGKWADGGGSSLELIDPESNHRLAANWADSDESAKSTWSAIETSGVLDLGHPSVSTAEQLQVLLLGAGEALLDNVHVFDSSGSNRVSNSDFERGNTDWFFQGTHRFTSAQTYGGYDGRSVLHLRASEKGNQMVDRVRTPLTSALQPGQTATIRAKARWLCGWPEILLRLKGGYLEAFGRLAVPLNLGTPGTRNSRARANGGPAIYDVSHRPVLPLANQAVRVNARLEDNDGLGVVRLNYRLDPASTLFSVTMADDGQNGDTLRGDGILTGTIPGQPGGTLIAFHIEAVDAAAAPATNRFPADARARECLVRVGETVPAGAFGAYRFWITQSSHSFWSSREVMSSENLDATFVYGNQRVVYNVGARYGGSIYTAGGYNSPTGNLCRYDLDFPEDDPLLGETRVMLDWPVRDGTAQREQLMWWFLEQYGLPNNHRRYIHLFVNGLRRGTIYEDAQKPGGDPVEEWFPEDPEGHLFKTDVWDEFTDDGLRIGSLILLNSLENFTTTGGITKTSRYRWNWEPRDVRGTANDYGPLFALVDAANAPDGAYQPAIEGLVDVEHWMKTFCMNDLASYWDGFGNPNGKNTYLYKPERDRWQLMCYDFDVGLGVMGDPVDAPLFPSLDDPVMVRLQAFPAFRRHYWRALDLALSGFFRTGPGTAIDAFLDSRYAAFQTNGVALSSPAGIKDWIQQRRAFLLSQLASVAANFSVSAAVTSLTNLNLATLTGTAPVTVKRITVNGISYSPKWDSVTSWRMLVPLAPGANVLNVQCYNEFDRPITGAGAILTLSFTGAAPAAHDSIVINEIMFAPLLPEASYVELYNLSTNYSFDLSGWRFNGLDFTFPQGSTISNRQHLVLAKDPAAFGAAYGWEIPVAGWFGGKLQLDGETLTLQPPGTNAAEHVLRKVRYRNRGPWPEGAIQSGASLQLVDSAQDNWRVGNWGVASTNALPPSDPQWVYVTETGTASSTPRLYIYLESAGDIYVDDMQLVRGTVPGTGANLLVNGNFESSLSGTWNLTANFEQSVTSSAQKRSGNSSLHLIASAAGTGGDNSIYQDAALTSGEAYAVSFWYLQSTNGGPLTVRLSGSGLTTGAINVAPPTPPAPPAPATPGAANSIARVLPPFQPLYVNEVQAENLTGIANLAGERTPWLELFNPSTNPVSLDGLYLANQYTNLLAWAFPTGIVLQAGEFKVVFADGRTDLSSTNEPHASFILSPNSGSLALSRVYNSQPQVLDYVDYGGVPANQSFGSTPDAQSFDVRPFFYVTPGATNNPASAPLPVVINEWMASNTNTIRNPVTGKFNDWFELYNYSTNTVDLMGYYLTDTLTNQFKFRIPAGYSIPPKAFLLVWADNEDTNDTPDLHLTFKMNKDGESLGLYGADGRAVDFINYGRQLPNTSEGRYPDGSFSSLLLPRPTPGTNNASPNTAPVFASPGEHFIYPGQTVTLVAHAYDAEVPPQVLTYALDAGAPPDSALDASSGLFTWSPSVTQLPSTNTITLHVTDNGTPQMTASTSVAVIVLFPPLVEAFRINQDTLTLVWPSVLGQRYRLEYAEDLSAPVWLPFGTEQAGTGGPLSWDADCSSAVPRFYRLVIIH
jgi:hypothetical protein